MVPSWLNSRKTMSYQSTLVKFLSAALCDKRDRVVGFAASPRQKTQRKILPFIYHEFECLFSSNLLVNSLPESAWESPAYLFCKPHHLGTAFPTLRDAVDHPTKGAERLALTQDGTYGCLRTEMSGDILVCIKIKKT